VRTILMLTGAACLAISSSGTHAEALGGLAFSETTPRAASMTARDDFTIVGAEDLMTLDALNDDGTVRAIIEIPTGTSAKWEVNKDDPNTIYWEYKNGKPRVVEYLGYPGNYGSIPGTALPKELGGDGDPLDVIVLGQAVPRGEIVDVRIIGVLKMLDDGEQDDKLIAVLTRNSPFAHVESMAQLDAEFSRRQPDNRSLVHPLQRPGRRHAGTRLRRGRLGTCRAGCRRRQLPGCAVIPAKHG
jgi:inorganic pyrophosphatase